MSEKRLLTEAEAAEYLRRPARTLKYWRTAGTGPAFHKIGRKPMYDIPDLERFIEQGRRVPAVEAFIDRRRSLTSRP